MLRRQFLKASSLAIAAAGTPELARAALQAENRAGAMPQKSYPPLTGPFRLPQEWYKQTTARFQKQLGEKKLDGAVVTGSDNINYLTGSFAVSTERPIWLYVPASGDPAVFHPGLDRDLWNTWWVPHREWYFDFPHHGEFNKLVWQAGPKADLFDWMAKGIVALGTKKGRIGFEKAPSDSESATLRRVAPQLQPESKTVSDLLLHMREVK